MEEDPVPVRVQAFALHIFLLDIEILGSGHYANNGVSPLDALCLAPLGPPHLLGPQGNPTVVSLVDYLWQRPLP